MNPAIIIPAFSRAHSLKRLLNSIENSTYLNNDIQLIISLDGGASENVFHVARNFTFSHGTVDVIERTKNLGLRKHILWCGDQTEKYGSVIVLEDDLVVDPFFYIYAKEAIAFYKDEKKVAGIAIYSPRYNEHAKLPFEPSLNGTSGYFMSVACSWGQAWTSSQWNHFKNWYKETNENEVKKNEKLPDDLKQWPASSWKKYFASYLTYSKSFVFYPYQSYTSNCAEPGGEHIKMASNNFQVPLGLSKRKHNQSLMFPSVEEHSLQYDAFMEPAGKWIEEIAGVNEDELEVDVYGIKPLSLLQKKKFCITSRNSRKPIKTYPLKFRPVVQNFYYPDDAGKIDGIVLTISKDIIRTDSDEIRIKLANYFTYFELGTKEFVRAYKKHVLLKKKRKKVFFWVYRKIRYPFRLFNKMFRL